MSKVYPMKCQAPRRVRLTRPKGTRKGSSIDRVIARLAERIGREYKPQQVILFGDCARGIPAEASDIDLLIIKDTDARKVDRFVEVKRLIFDPQQFKIHVSPLIYTPQELEQCLQMGDDFVGEIVREGKVVYEAAL